MRESLAAGHDAQTTLSRIRDLARRKAAESAGNAQSLRGWLNGPLPAQLQASREWLAAAPNRHFITWGGPNWPRAFAGLRGMPIALYAEGDLDLLAHPQVAIVGSRNPTPTGGRVAERLAFQLAQAGVGIVSGLATGIDACAHLGALRAEGITIAVCGRGLDDTYPASNRRLAAQIAESGLLLSEYTPGTPPQKANFPARNRIIAALGQGTLVVEATPRSGSLITAKQALGFGRDVFAVPGSIDNPLARGCHQLIREGAHLVESAADIVEVLAPNLIESVDRREAAEIVTPAAESAVTPEEQQLIDALDGTPTTIDALVTRTGLKAADISSMLLIMELQGTVAIAPGGGYQKIGQTT